MKLFNVLLLSVAVVYFCACSDETSQTDDTKKDGVKTYDEMKSEALTSMESAFALMSKSNITDPVQIGNFDFETPRAKFEVLKIQRPDDKEVRVSLAMCQMLSLYRDPVFKEFLKEMSANGVFQVQTSDVPLSLGFIPFNMGSVLSQEMLINSVNLMIKRGIKDPTGSTLLQGHFSSALIPQLQSAIENFEFVENSSSNGIEYQYALTGKMMGFPSLPSQYMDNTEFFMMDGYLEYLKGMLHMYCIVDFKNSDFSEVQWETLPDIDTKNPDFSPYLFLADKIKIRPDGAVHGQKFIDGLTRSSNDMIASLRYLLSEKDTQQDDVIKKTPELNDQAIALILFKAEQQLAKLESLIKFYLDLFAEKFPFPVSISK